MARIGISPPITFLTPSMTLVMSVTVTFEGDEHDAAILRENGYTVYTVIERRQVDLPSEEMLRAMGSRG